MYPVEYHLKELLLDYDCVTVPGLGGFILQFKPAWINRSKNRIYPPSRAISFNSLLDHDDGLLISAIATSRQITYREAAVVVSDFADTCKRKTGAGETIAIEDIGELSAGPEGKLKFMPYTTKGFNNEVFGMAPISLYSRVEAPQPVRLAQNPADRKIPRLKEKKQAPVKWTLALALPVILFLLYGIIFPHSLQNIYTQYSGMNIEFLPAEKHIVQTSAPVPEVLAPVIEVIAQPVATKVEMPVETAASPKYYIIGGCFESEENADKFLRELSKRGFDAEIAGTTNRGHRRISYKSFNEKSPALSYLQEIRATENASAWLLKY